MAALVFTFITILALVAMSLHQGITFVLRFSLHQLKVESRKS